MAAKQSSGNLNIDPIWVVTAQYCQLDENGLNTGSLMFSQIDGNPDSESYGTTREIIAKEDSEFCPVTNAAAWRLTGNRRCVKDADNRNTGYCEKEEKDVNPLSETFNQLRWIDAGSDLDDCPIPPNPFMRLLAEGVDIPAANWAASLNFLRVETGEIYTLQLQSGVSLINYTEAVLPPGEYKITAGAGSASGVYGTTHYVSRIYLPGVFDYLNDGFDDANAKTPNLNFAANYVVNLQENKAIRVVFTAYP